ncbi:MAG: hypothetical protein ACFFF4_13935 [Candidatus Thorarchaeota archaeon]
MSRTLEYIWPSRLRDYDNVRALLLPNESIQFATTGDINGSHFLTLTDRRVVVHGPRGIQYAIPFHVLREISKPGKKWVLYHKILDKWDGRPEIVQRSGKLDFKIGLLDIEQPKTVKGEDKKECEILFNQGLELLPKKIVDVMPKVDQEVSLRSIDHLLDLSKPTPMFQFGQQNVARIEATSSALGKQSITLSTTDIWNEKYRNLAITIGTEQTAIYRTTTEEKPTIVISKYKPDHKDYESDQLWLNLLSSPWGYDTDDIMAIGWDWLHPEHGWKILSPRHNEFVKETLAGRGSLQGFGSWTIDIDTNTNFINHVDISKDRDNPSARGFSRVPPVRPWYSLPNFPWIFADAYYYVTSNPLPTCIDDIRSKKPGRYVPFYLY